MANYYATIRTNYFAVTDEVKFRKIIDSCSAEDTIHILENIAPDGTKTFGFGCYGYISGIHADADEEDMDETDLDAFYFALQSVLAEGDAIIIMEVGNEKLRYLIGVCTVITRSDIQGVDVSNKALDLVRTMLANPDFTTEMYY